MRAIPDYWRRAMNEHLVRGRMTPAALLVALVLLAGCGSSSGSRGGQAATVATQSAAATTAPQTTSTQTTSTATSQTSAVAPAPKHAEERVPVTEKIAVASPVVPTEGVLPSQYTCDGRNVALPLRWTGIPAGTAELMLDVLDVNPVHGQLFFDWAVAGLKPGSTGITGGKLPAGAVAGTNGFGRTGYDLCPAKGAPEKYVVVLFALPHKLGVKKGFDPTALRRQALRHATYEGFLFFSYKRH
jgi:phosphatidylethanolamine-binding protein (PEBP) family uncharacterized protein